MRHPLMRILVALLVGVWAPICCCRATTFLNTSCRETVAHATVSEESCCSRGCRTSTPEATPDHDPLHDGRLPPGGCKTCPSCVGSSGASGVLTGKDGPSKATAMNEVPAMLPAPIVVVRRGMPVAPPNTRNWSGDQGCQRANRSALRWHCALNV